MICGDRSAQTGAGKQPGGALVAAAVGISSLSPETQIFLPGAWGGFEPVVRQWGGY